MPLRPISLNSYFIWLGLILIHKPKRCRKFAKTINEYYIRLFFYCA